MPSEKKRTDTQQTGYEAAYWIFVIIVFAFICFLYAIFFAQIIRLDDITTYTTTLHSGWFYLFMVLWGVLAALNASYSSSILNEDPLESTRWFALIYATVMSFIFVILDKYHSIVDIFGNTLGYFIPIGKIKELLKSRAFPDKPNITPFLSLFDLDNFSLYNQENMEETFDITLTNESKLADFQKQIAQYCLQKRLVGHMIWVFLTSVLIMLATTYKVAKKK
jgi:hypothetical protein